MTTDIKKRVKAIIAAYSASIQNGSDLPVIQVQLKKNEEVYFVDGDKEVSEALTALAGMYGEKGIEIESIAVASGAYMSAGEMDKQTKQVVKTGEKIEVAIAAASDRQGNKHVEIARIIRVQGKIETKPYSLPYQQVDMNILDFFWRLYHSLRTSELN